MDESINGQLQAELNRAQELCAHLTRENHFLQEENNSLVMQYNKLAEVYNKIMHIFEVPTPEVDKLRKVKQLLHEAKDT